MQLVGVQHHGVIAARQNMPKEQDTPTYTPVSIESSRVCDAMTLGFLTDLRNCLGQITREESSFMYLFHRL